MDNGYVVTPGLVQKVSEFEAHCRVAGRSPIMICGPSGVGKSLFLSMFKNIYRSKFGEAGKVITVNCSHFEGDLARSELFGHKKGAFTGAVGDNEGWIARADGGVLILEEVGDLPRETQAKLLTFIEDGAYHRVGEVELASADVQIIAATNNESSLREDFRYRFFPFYVPGLHQRRQDVIYYLALKFPELIGSLRPWELLTLLAYHWPGNVREVERVGYLLQRSKCLEDATPVDLLQAAISFLQDEWKKSCPNELANALSARGGLAGIDSRSTALEHGRADRLFFELKANGIDAGKVESILNRFNLGLSSRNASQPLRNIGDALIRGRLKTDRRLGVRVFEEIAEFKAISRGLEKFCALFLQNDRQDENLLNVTRVTLDSAGSPNLFDLKPDELGLIGSILKWIEKRRTSPSEDGLGHILRMSLKELHRVYLGGLLENAGGNQALAARRAGVKYNTFRDMIKRSLPGEEK